MLGPRRAQGDPRRLPGEARLRLFHLRSAAAPRIHRDQPLHRQRLSRNWLKEYIENNYYEIDPVVKHCTRFHEPYCWDRLHEEAAPEVAAFAAAAASHGLVGGISAGIHDYASDNGIFSLAVDRVIETGSDEALEAILHLNALVPAKPGFSKREHECLLWSAEGKTTDEIATILAISSATAAFHLKNVIQKLEVTNRNQAIAKATPGEGP